MDKRKGNRVIIVHVVLPPPLHSRPTNDPLPSSFARTTSQTGISDLKLVLQRLKELALTNNWLTSVSELQHASNLLVLDIG